jgi:hypothetical protein
MSDILQEASSAMQRGDITLAKQLLSQAVIKDPTNEAAWMMMSQVAGDIKSKRNYLERVLAINPKNVDANLALTRLTTSPLSPVTRGERDKPIYQSNFDKIPPFTSPDTWGNDQEQFLAPPGLSNPDLPVDQPIQTPETTPTFDWAHDSEEPDKTIDQLFIAVSSPELASQPRPNTDLTWLDQNQSALISNPVQDVDAKSDAMWLDELVGTDVEPLPEVSIGTLEGFPMDGEPEPGSDGVVAAEQPEESITSDYQLWDNPKTKKDRMIILSDTSLIYANPKESDIPHILGLFADKKMIRDLLGDKAGLIKMESIRRLLVNPKKSDLSIDYVDSSKKKITHKLTFLSLQIRDEVLGAIKSKPGSEYRETVQIFRLQDKIVPPLAVLLLLIFLIWGLNAGLPMLSALTASELGILAPIVSLMMGIVLSIGRTTLFLIYFLGGLFSLAWLVVNLKKPSKLIIMERI